MVRRIPAALVVFAILAAGCGNPPPGGKAHPVEGVVMINGTPVENIQVRLMPDPTKGGKGAGAVGISGPGGKYALKTDDGRDGAMAGFYVVSLTDLAAGRTEQGEKEIRNRVPAAHQSAVKSPLKVEVREGPNSIPLDVK
jgi:hypothetical protein